jgi:multidrug transporter EmrE-like cation transporter
MIVWKTLLYGLLMASIDTSMLGLIKSISLDGTKNLGYMIIPTLAYAIQPWIFLSALKTETMTVMNLIWDLTSAVLVSLLGKLYFGEKLGLLRTIGLLLGMVSLTLLSYKGKDDT